MGRRQDINETFYCLIWYVPPGGFRYINYVYPVIIEDIVLFFIKLV